MRPGVLRCHVPALVALCGLAVPLAVTSCGGEAEPSSTHPITETRTTETEPVPTDTVTVIRIEVRDGVPAGGIVRERAGHGDRVVLEVESDVADEIHLHGYDLKRALAVGRSARIAFRATIRGRFEVELEERGVQIAELTVE